MSSPGFSRVSLQGLEVDKSKGPLWALSTPGRHRRCDPPRPAVATCADVDSHGFCVCVCVLFWGGRGGVGILLGLSPNGAYTILYIYIMIIYVYMFTVDIVVVMISIIIEKLANLFRHIFFILEALILEASLDGPNAWLQTWPSPESQLCVDAPRGRIATGRGSSLRARSRRSGARSQEQIEGMWDDAGDVAVLEERTWLWVSFVHFALEITCDAGLTHMFLF